MTEHVLSFKPAIGAYGAHDPSAAIFRDGELLFGVEEERYTRNKHAVGQFPENAIRACLSHAGVDLSEVSSIVLPYKPELRNKNLLTDLTRTFERSGGLRDHAWNTLSELKDHVAYRSSPVDMVLSHLRRIGTPVPDVSEEEHHRCHAATAFHPTDSDEAVVLTLDGVGEYDSTVVWHGTPDGLERIETYRYPNSLGHFFGAVTEYLGFRAFNGEGKIMGLAPYGDENPDIESRLRDAASFGMDYDVTELLGDEGDVSPTALEELFDRPPRGSDEDFDPFHKDLAYTAQKLLEETVTEIAAHHLDAVGTGQIGLAGGVALNCKANKRVMELEEVDEIFVQPVAHDGGLALGAGWLQTPPGDVEPMTNAYWGPEPAPEEIETLLEENRLVYERTENVETFVARQLADGALVGWMQGRLEMGPRALGNRSILADPRTSESRDRVNEFVKHREEWRPFAPSMLEEAAEDYLENAEPAPYMIKTFDTIPETRDDLEAVVHPADDTTRPQTVREDQNPRYHRLISAFGEITGVPVLLNTSFNDHGEPIVTTPKEAIRDFYGMGLDLLVIEDYVVRKEAEAYPKDADYIPEVPR